MSYSDVVTILSLAPNCADIAQAALERLALESAAARLLKSLPSRQSRSMRRSLVQGAA